MRVSISKPAFGSYVRRAARAYMLLWLAQLGCRDAHEVKAARLKELRTIRLEHAFPEASDRPLLPGVELSHADLLARIGALATQSNVTGLLLQVSEMGSAWSRAADLRDALNEFRKQHKPVHCHFEAIDNAGYALLARSCDRISMTPSGTLNLVGVALDAVYARKLLASVGLNAELLQAGRFKGAADPFTRDDMPLEVRQTMGALLDDLQASLVASVSEGRALDPSSVQSLIDRGPFTAQAALAAGLVDEVLFDDAARASAKKAAHAERVVDDVPPKEHEPKGLFDLVSTLMSSGQPDKPMGPRLGLVILEGTILRGTPASIRSAHAESFVRAMREFANERDIRAIVLRIDSPGGSALASDLMWHAVRRAVKRKPVIVSIGDVCASGGYYVASAGSEVMAQDEALVGSIGVVGGKIVAQELAQRIGIHVEHLARGKHAGWTSPLSAWTADERAAIEASLQSTYDLFIARISEGRNLKPAEIAPYAEGRLMSARRAREGHLVDRVGGLRSAIAAARERGKLAANAPIQVWPGRPSLFQTINELTDRNSSSEAALERSSMHSLAEALFGYARPGIIETLLAGEAESAAVLPYVLTLR